MGRSPIGMMGIWRAFLVAFVSFALTATTTAQATRDELATKPVSVEVVRRGVDWDSIVAQLTAALVGAFAGAWFAFLFERKTAERDNRSLRLNACNRALFTLARYYNVLFQYRSDILSVIEKDRTPWLNLPPHTLRSVGTIDFMALSFLIDEKE